MPDRQDDPRWTQPTEVIPAAPEREPAAPEREPAAPEREPAAPDRQPPAPGRDAGPRRHPEPPSDPLTDPAVLPLLSDGKGPLRAARPAQPPLRARLRRSRAVIIAAGVLGLLALVYLVDLVATRGDIPRGTVVAGVPIGGMSRTAAETALRRVLEPRQDRPVPVRAGVIETSLQPATAGLTIDWPATMRAAGRQTLNPIIRLGSFLGTHTRPVVTAADGDALNDVLDGMNTLVHRDPVDAGVRFEGLTPVEVQAVPGQDLDVPGAAAAIRQSWFAGSTIVLPVRPTPPTGNVTADAVRRAITEVAQPAVAAEVRVIGEQAREAVLTPATIAAVLSFAPDGSGGLNPVLDLPEAAEALRPQLASTERPGRDASMELIKGRPTVRPSADGHGVDYKATLAGLLDVLKQGAGIPDARRITAIYADQPAKLTTEQLAELGITDLVSSFSTSGFAKDSGQNIKRAAEQVNGTILRPGETFSLNGATGPREAAEGYVDAGIIQDGHPARGIGGGVSQLATTLYNAAYFAGMVDVAHKEHSYYISRYPVAREATVYEGAIDLKFRNDQPTGIFIETVWTASTITVRFWGTKHVEVTSTPGEKKGMVAPQTLTIPAGQPCTPSEGGQGFTATDTRTMTDVETGKTTSSTRTVKYKPSPKIVCAGGPTPAR